jgi:archaellum biogenesis protein FlaJ (TadC family)
VGCDKEKQRGGSMSERELLTKLALLSSENVRLKEINQKLKKQNANYKKDTETVKQIKQLIKENK